MNHFSKGNLRLSFGNALLPLPDSLDEFLLIYGPKKNAFTLDDYCELQPVKQTQIVENKLHYTFGIKYMKEIVPVLPSSRQKKPTEQASTDRSNKGAADIDILKKIQEEARRQFGKGDAQNDGDTGDEDKGAGSASHSAANRSPKNSPKRSIQPTCLENVPKLSKRCAQSIPRTFSYNLVLKDCKFNRKPLPGFWQVRLDGLLSKSHLLVFTKISNYFQLEPS